MNKLEKIKLIKSHKEPPYIKDDCYYQRHPWPLFGGVDMSSVFAGGWNWYKDEYIMRNTTEEDVDAALKELGDME